MTHQEKIDHLREFYPSLPDNLSVGGWLDLSGTAITSLPDNLTVGGSLYLRGTAIAECVQGCGDKNRTIAAYNHATRGRVVSLGCFIGTEEECIEAIKREYSGKSAADYIAKVKQAFAYKKA